MGNCRSLLSDLPLFLRLLYPLFLKFLGDVVGSASPGRQLLRFYFQGCCVKVCLLQGYLEGILVPLILASIVAFLFRKLTKEEALGESLIWHSCNVASPSDSGLLQECLHAADFCKGQDLCVRGFLFRDDA